MADQRPLRIGLDALSIIPGQIGGGETYTVNLYRQLLLLPSPHRFVLFTTPANRGLFAVDAANVEEAVCLLPARASARFVWEQAALPWQIRRWAVDVVHYPANILALASGRPSLLTMHDLSVEYYRRELPTHYRPTAANRIRLAARRLSAQRADRVVAVSNFTRRELETHLDVPPERVAVVYEGVDRPPRGQPAPPHPLGPDGPPYVLFVGTKLAHKNLPRLLEAFATLRRACSLPHRLVLVGRRGAGFGAPESGAAEVDDAVARLGLGEAVLQQERVEDRDLAAWYAHADLFAFPSLYEGFGLPPLEAMARGVPVICSDAASLPEVVGDAALLFDARDGGAIETALARGLGDEGWRRQARSAGPARASSFRWQDAARAVLALLEETAGLRGTARDAGTGG